MAATRERVHCPGCGRSVLLLKDGRVASHRDHGRQCPWAGKWPRAAASSPDCRTCAEHAADVDEPPVFLAAWHHEGHPSLVWTDAA